jgi:hypothetical protein
MASFFGLDMNRSALHAFVAEYYCYENPEALSWPTENLNVQAAFHQRISHSVVDEVHGPFLEAYRLIAQIPGMPDLGEPV